MRKVNRKLFIFTFILLLFPACCSALEVYPASSMVDAELKVYITTFYDWADALVYITDSKMLAERKPLVWHFSDNKLASKKIYFVPRRTDADLVVKITEFESLAHWLNHDKERLLN